ncbi:ANTAR domain-containing response regulator [Hoeflea sp.]|uniref:ANTAR domain-containing response regulator n=1 Tax=Hoeflea sp. TaxID=1940281 RepID=UPI003B021D81
MTETGDFRDENLLRKLRRMRILVIHPEDAERENFLAHLKRIGCQVDSTWPAPQQLPDHVDVVLFLLNRSAREGGIAWMASDLPIAKIAIINFETPEILGELQKLSVHGVLSKPIRLFGVLAVLTAAINLARHEARLQQRIRSLDETLKARRKIEKAVAILSESRSISEEEAYQRIRKKSQESRESVGVIAEAIIASEGL